MDRAQDFLPSQAVITFSVEDCFDNGPVTRTAYSGILAGGKERIDWVDGDLVRIYSDKASDTEGSSYADYIVSDARPGAGAAEMRGYASLKPAAKGRLRWGSGMHRFYGIYPAPGKKAAVSFDGENAFSLSMPATQSYVLDGSLLKPDMAYAYMAATTESEPTGTVSLSFQPLFSAFQFTVESRDNTWIMLYSFTLRSASKALAGTFKVEMDAGHPGAGVSFTAFPEATDENKTVSILFNEGRGVRVSKGAPLTFTVFTLPQEYDDLSASFVTNNGEKILRVQDAEGKPVTFRPARKYYMDQLGIPGSWQYSADAIPDIRRTLSGVLVDYSQDINVNVKRVRSESEVKVPWKFYFNDSYTRPSIGTALQPEWNEAPLQDEDGNDWLEFSAYSGNGDNDAVSIRLSPASVIDVEMQPGTDAAAMMAELVQNNLGTVDLSTLALGTGGVFVSGNLPATANCYVLNGYGTFYIPLVYGNGVQDGAPAQAYLGVGDGERPLPVFVNADGNPIESDYILEDNGLSKSGHYEGRVIWQDTASGFEILSGDDVHFLAAPPAGAALSCAYLSFTLRPENIKPGNIVLGLYDKDEEKVLWSWHIWITAESFSVKDVYYKEGEYTSMLSCNLGWAPPVSYTGGRTKYRTQNVIVVCTETNKAVCSFVVTQFVYNPSALTSTAYSGTFYQWGRKDPFLGSNGRSFTTQYSTDRSNKAITSDFFSMDEVTMRQKLPNGAYATSDPARNLGESIRNPHVMYSGQNMPWFYNLWNADNATNAAAPVKKSIYDPSPRGFKIPRRDAYTGLRSGDFSSSASKGNDAMWVDQEGEIPPGCFIPRQYKSAEDRDLFFPCSGYRFSSSAMYYQSSYGRYWTAEYAHYILSLGTYFKYLYLTGENSPSSGFSVRPVAE